MAAETEAGARRNMAMMMLMAKGLEMSKEEAEREWTAWRHGVYSCIMCSELFRP
jgi:hypothetical protein